ncbi:MAG: glycosyltransferase family 87 protein [Candidatus Methanomethylicaceae archaeon]
MVTETNSKTFKYALLICCGLIAFYSLLYSSASTPIVGGKDWVDAFRQGAKGDLRLVVTPYWSLFLSYLPSRLPDPLGYSLWIGIGALLTLIAAHYFRSPLLAVLISYQLNWVLFYGQIDGFVAFGIALGAFALERNRPFLLGLSISLLLIKPQVGLLLSLHFLWRSPHRLKTALAFLLPVAASIVLWPPRPEVYLITHMDDFIQRPNNIITNTSLRLPMWLVLPIAALALLLPNVPKKKIQSLVAANLLISPYSTIYSQLSLLCVGLPLPLYIFGIIPWAVAIILGPFGHWQWASLFPLLVLTFNFFTLLRNSRRVNSSALTTAPKKDVNP